MLRSLFLMMSALFRQRLQKMIEFQVNFKNLSKMIQISYMGDYYLFRKYKECALWKKTLSRKNYFKSDDVIKNTVFSLYLEHPLSRTKVQPPCVDCNLFFSLYLVLSLYRTNSLVPCEFEIDRVNCMYNFCHFSNFDGVIKFSIFEFCNSFNFIMWSYCEKI